MSAEEWRMRELVVARCRNAWPDARIIHELSLDYARCRIDIAAVRPASLIAIEIKASTDGFKRLRAQLRGFSRVAEGVIVAVAPTMWARRAAALREAIDDISPDIGIWVVCADTGTITVERQRGSREIWTALLFDLLHKNELVEIARQYGVPGGAVEARADLAARLGNALTSFDARAASFAALRRRAAVRADSDPPVEGG
mgnify:CR=1 FL=1